MDDKIRNFIKTREHALKKIDIEGNLESVAYTLLAERARGEFVCCEYNGKKLYNIDKYTVDDFFQSVYEVPFVSGKDNDDTKERIEKVRSYINEGFKLIFPEKRYQWEKFIIDVFSSTYHMIEPSISAALAAMEFIELGYSFDMVVPIIAKYHDLSGFYINNFNDIIFNYCKQGPEFLEYLYGEPKDIDTKKRYEEKRAENKELEEKNKNISENGTTIKK